MNFREHVEFRSPGILDSKIFSLGRQFAGANGLTDNIVLRLYRVLINLIVKTIIGQLFVCLLYIQVPIPDYDRSTFICWFDNDVSAISK